MSTLSTKRPSQSDAFKEKLIQDVQGEGDEIVRVNFTIEKRLARELKVKCAQDGRTISDLLRGYVLGYLGK
jgi:hypothetical protein